MSMSNMERIHSVNEMVRSFNYGIEIEMSTSRTMDQMRLQLDAAGLSGWTAHEDCSIITSPDNPEKIELNSPMLTFADVVAPDGQIARLIALLTDKSLPAIYSGKTAKGFLGGGIHIHVSDPNGRDKDPRTLVNLVNLQYQLDEFLYQLCGTSQERLGWCAPIGEALMRGVNRLKAPSYDDIYALYNAPGECSTTRYHSMNLVSLFWGKGVEYRLFEFDYRRMGGDLRKQLIAFVEIAGGMLAKCIISQQINKKGIKYNPLDTDNSRYVVDKFTTSNWGWIGDEFKIGHQYTQELTSGDAVNRYSCY